MKKKVLLLILLSTIIVSWTAVPTVAIVELYQEGTTNHPESYSNLEFQIWLNTSHVTEFDHTGTYNLGEVAYDTAQGLFSVNAANLFTSFEPGDVLHIWIKNLATDANLSAPQEAQIDISLGYNDQELFIDSNALELVSEVITENVNTTAVDYAFNTGTRNNERECTVSITSPETASGSITVGLLDGIPSSIPVAGQAVDLAFIYGTQNLEGSGTFNIKISWGSDLTLDSSTPADMGIFISEDGNKWINTKNYANGTSNFNWSVDNLGGDDYVTFDIDHIPNSIVLGDGSATYTETTPDTPGGQKIEVSGGNITLKWNKSTLPGADYTIEKQIPGSNWDTVIDPTINESSGVKFTSFSIPTDKSYFYRVKANNNSGQSSAECATFGYCRYDLVSGWNMIAYALGDDNYSLQKFYNDGDNGNNSDPYGDINNIAAGSSTKVWNETTQSWTAYTSSTSSNVTLDKGDVIMVQTTGTGTWYSTGIIDNSAHPYQYTLNYQDGLSGYNLVMIPFNKSGITTVAGLYDDIFGSSAPTDYKRTLSWYSASDEGYYTYEDGPVPASWNSAVELGTPVMIHVNSDDSITWPQ